MNDVLILGAGSDVGKALAVHYAKSGHAIWLAGRDRQNLEEVCADLRIRFQVDVHYLPFDARNFSSHEEFVAALPDTIAQVFCVFGYLGDQPLAMQSWPEALKIIETNYTGAVSVCNLLLGKLSRRGGGVLVGISSVAGERGRQSNFMYGSAKAGFTAYLSGLRNYSTLTATGVHVLTVKPGFMYTRMTEHLKLPKPLTAQPEQTARLIARAVARKKNVIYVLPVWRWIMWIIRSIPESLFIKLKL